MREFLQAWIHYSVVLGWMLQTGWKQIGGSCLDEFLKISTGTKKVCADLLPGCLSFSCPLRVNRRVVKWQKVVPLLPSLLLLSSHSLSPVLWKWRRLHSREATKDHRGRGKRWDEKRGKEKTVRTKKQWRAKIDEMSRKNWSKLQMADALN